MSDQVAEGQRVLVTAGAAGIGRAIVEALVEAGARVHLCDVDEPALAALADGPAERRVTPWPTSRTRPRSTGCSTMCARGSAASTCWSTMPASPARPQPIEEIDPADWRRCIDVDLTGQFLCARRAVPMLKAAGGGAIVNMSSAAGRLRLRLPDALSAAKWGVIGLTQSLAKELGPHDITVNAILPGMVAGAAHRAGDRRPRRAARPHLRGDGAPVPREGLAAPDGDRRTRSRPWSLFLISPLGRGVSGQSLGVCGNVETL